MYTFARTIVLGVPLLFACTSGFPVPTQRLADAQSAARSASELGAENEPAAQLSLRLANEQIASAVKAMKAGDNEGADSLLLRATADAELAIVQSREKTARGDLQEAVDDSKTQNVTNSDQGAIK